MRWMLMGCLFGAIGAMLGRIQSPMKFWVNTIGLIVFVLGIFDLLRLSSIGNRNSGSGDSGADFDSNTSCDSSGDCGGGDGTINLISSAYTTFQKINFSISFY